MLHVERTKTEQGQRAQKRDLGFEVDHVNFVSDVDNGQSYFTIFLEARDSQEEIRVRFPIDMLPWKIAKFIVDWKDNLSLEDLK